MSVFVCNANSATVTSGNNYQWIFLNHKIAMNFIMILHLLYACIHALWKVVELKLDVDTLIYYLMYVILGFPTAAFTHGGKLCPLW